MSNVHQHVGCERTWCASAAGQVAALIAGLGLFALSHDANPGTAAAWCAALILATNVALTLVSTRQWGESWYAVLLLGSAIGVVGGLGLHCPLCGLAVPVAATVHRVVAKWIVLRLPRQCDGCWHTRRCLASIAALLSVLCVLQVARFSVFMVDPGFRIGWPNPLSTHSSYHMCLTAYLHAAELNRLGVRNVFDPAYYDPARQVALAGVQTQSQTTGIEGMQALLKDPFQYPPTALLLPRLAISMTNRLAAIRTAWFALQALTVLVFLALFSRGMPRGPGERALLLLPMVWLSHATLVNFAYGQPHCFMLACAALGMSAFEQGRNRTGGLLLALAISLKVAPVFLVAYLWGQRRFSAVTATLVWSIAIAVLTWLVLGPDPWIAFFQYQVPRLMSGEAFTNFSDSAQESLQTYNMSFAGTVYTLAGLRVPYATAAVARGLSLGYAIAVVVLAWWAGRRRQSHAALTWFALLCLSSFASFFAPAEYAVTGPLYLLVFCISWYWDRPRVLLGVAAAWLFTQVVPFTRAVPKLASMVELRAVLMILGFMLSVVLSVWVVLRPPGSPENDRTIAV
jgi:hypothetical protein